MLLAKELLSRLPLVPEVRKWLQNLPDYTCVQEAWEACPHPDWLLTMVRHSKSDFSVPLRRFAVDCATRILNREREEGREYELSCKVAEVTTRYLDGVASIEDYQAVVILANKAKSEVYNPEAWRPYQQLMARAVAWLMVEEPASKAASNCYLNNLASAGPSCPVAALLPDQGPPVEVVCPIFGHKQHPIYLVELKWSADRLHHYFPYWPG